MPNAVFDECSRHGDRPGTRAIVAAGKAGLFSRVVVIRAEQFGAKQRLDVGESAALVLAQSRSAAVLLDERKKEEV